MAGIWTVVLVVFVLMVSLILYLCWRLVKIKRYIEAMDEHINTIIRDTNNRLFTKNEMRKMLRGAYANEDWYYWEDETCEWKEVIHNDKIYWRTECGNTFQLIDGTPGENHMNYCPFCRKIIKEKRLDDENENSN